MLTLPGSIDSLQFILHHFSAIPSVQYLSIDRFPGYPVTFYSSVDVPCHIL